MITFALVFYALYTLSAVITLLFIVRMAHRDLSKGRAPLSLLVAVGCITLIICAIPVLNTILAASFIADCINPAE